MLATGIVHNSRLRAASEVSPWATARDDTATRPTRSLGVSRLPTRLIAVGGSL